MNNKAQSRVAHSGLQAPPTPNPEGVLQHDVRCTDTIMNTAPVAYQSATTLSTSMHPTTIAKPRWGLGSGSPRRQATWGLVCRNARHPSSQRPITRRGGLRPNSAAPDHRELRKNDASCAPFRPRQGSHRVMNHSLGRPIALPHYPGRHLRSLYSRALPL